MPRVRWYPFTDDRFNHRANTAEDRLRKTDRKHAHPRHHPPVAGSSTTPINGFEALMSAYPTDPTPDSYVDGMDARAGIASLVETLEPRDRELVEALFWERLSLRECAARMGLSKTHVARLRDSVLLKMRRVLGESDI